MCGLWTKARTHTRHSLLLLSSFVPRHNSGTDAEIKAMVAATGFDSVAALIDATVPTSIRRKDKMDMKQYTAGMTESQFLEYFK